MPIYEYECGGCRKRFEHLQRRVGDVPSQCPHCAGTRLKKVLSGFSVSVPAGGPKHEPSAACSTCSHGSCPHSGH
ncbi:MAG: zinc ribbon domain-containing protein [Verrucomicrobia bacterium]|nr:zinc ribbon domain-containing protein [Verrucomicrobiota bacterium]MBU4291217.1 zinc ribbon domain-containing protein [Verrucomicrobiota bacterium]MBU4429275.1 zinc ribbon domain-containing protein [Verrucomicrobiota bacterium]